MLSEKYHLTFHRSQLLDQLLNLKQASLHVIDYLSRFQELMLRCDVTEEPWITVARFING